MPSSLQTFDLSTGTLVGADGFTGETAALSIPISPTPTVVNAPPTAPVNQTSVPVASPKAETKTETAKPDPTKDSKESKGSGFPNTNHTKEFVRITIGEQEYNSNAGQILRKKGTPVICLSSYMHSYAEFVLNDPKDEFRPEIVKKISEEVNIEIGFTGAESENKLVGKLYEVGRIPPDGTWIMVVDLSYELNNNTSPSVQFAGNAEAPVANTTSETVISSEEGNISFYGGTDGFDGKKTASGEAFDSNKLTAAHQKLPFGTQVKVTNLKNGKQVLVKVNDRGPYSGDRIMDLSKAAAVAIDMVSAGSTKAKLEVIGKTKSANSTSSSKLGNAGKPTDEKPTPANESVSGANLTPADLGVIGGAAASGDKGSTPAAEIFTATNSSLHFAKDTGFATGKAGSVRLQQTMLAFAQQEALLKGEVIVARGNTVHQVSATGADSSGVTLDYVVNRSCFRRDPKIIKRTNIQLQSGFGALSVVGYNIDGKQSVGATVVTQGAAPNVNPATLVNVPEFGTVKMGDKIPGQGTYTWADATHGGERVPDSKQVMSGIIWSAQVLEQLGKLHGVRFVHTSWYRDPSTNLRVSSSGAHGPHTTGTAVDFYCDSDAIMAKVYADLNANWPGGVAIKVSSFVHLDGIGMSSGYSGINTSVPSPVANGTPRRRWTY